MKRKSISLQRFGQNELAYEQQMAIQGGGILRWIGVITAIIAGGASLLANINALWKSRTKWRCSSHCDSIMPSDSGYTPIRAEAICNGGVLRCKCESVCFGTEKQTTTLGGWGGCIFG